MVKQFAKNARRVAAAAVLSVAIGSMMAMAQDTNVPPPPQQDQQGPSMGGSHGRGSPERQVEMLTKRLNLSPDQVTQVKAIDLDTMTQMKALRSDTTMSQEDRHSRMKDLHEVSMTKMRAVLNDEQKTKFDAMEAHRREHMHHGDGQAPSSPPPA